MNDGRRGNDDRALALGEHHRHVDEHARPERLVLVGQARAHLHRARRGVDRGIDGRDRAIDGSATIDARAERHAHRHADLQVRQPLLREGEVGVDAVDRLEHRDRRPWIEVLTEVHVADAEAPREGRAHRLLGDLSLERLYVGGRRLELRVVVVDLRGREGALVDQDAGAIGVGLREVTARNGRGELCALDARIELDERLTLPDDHARLEENSGHDARRLVAQRDAFGARHAAHCAQRALPRVALQGRGRDRLGRRARLLHLLAERDEGSDLLGLDASERGDDGDDSESGDDVSQGSLLEGRRATRRRSLRVANGVSASPPRGPRRRGRSGRPPGPAPDRTLLPAQRLSRIEGDRHGDSRDVSRQ